MTRTTEQSDLVEKFSLLGGPLYRLGCRLGLVREGANTIRLGLALGILLWIGLVIVALIEGVGHRLFSLYLIGAHVRLLVVIPLFFVCESWLAPRMKTFVSMIVRSGVVPANSLPALEYEIARTSRWKDSWLPEVVCAIAATLLSMFGSHLPLHGATSVFDPTQTVRAGNEMVLWVWIFCITVFRFLILRWLWRLGLWTFFLWRLSRLELRLIPTHPDNAAGLGYLQVVHTHFTPLVLAISAIQCASFAEELSSGTVTFEAIYPAMALVLVVDALLFLGPLFIFSSKLWACRVKGLSEYMEFAETYVSGFDRKWLRGGNDDKEPLLGTPDLQSLADLVNSITVVRNMRWTPMGRRLFVSLLIAALAPVLPLLLLKYPIGELVEKFVQRLTGL